MNLAAIAFSYSVYPLVGLLLAISGNKLIVLICLLIIS
jgi:hypothetical protein